MHHVNVSKAVTILILTNNKADVVSYSPLFTYDRSIHNHCVYHYHPSTYGTNHSSGDVRVSNFLDNIWFIRCSPQYYIINWETTYKLGDHILTGRPHPYWEITTGTVFYIEY